MLSKMHLAHQRYTQIKSNLRRHQKEVYDGKNRFLVIPAGNIVYIRKEPQANRTDMATRFSRAFDGPFQVLGHPYDRNDLLTLKDLSTIHALPHPINIDLLTLKDLSTVHALPHTINIEKCVVVPDQDTFDLQPPNDEVIKHEVEDLLGMSLVLTRS